MFVNSDCLYSLYLVLFHNPVGIDGLPQLTRACVVSIFTVTYHHFNITVAVAHLSVQENVSLTVESNRTNRLESILLRESNRNYFWRIRMHYIYVPSAHLDLLRIRVRGPYTTVGLTSRSVYAPGRTQVQERLPMFWMTDIARFVL